MGGPGRGPTIGPIAGVTINTPDLGASERAYVGSLGYRIVGREPVSVAQAANWGCPAAAGARALRLQPAAGDDFTFTLVETPALPGYRAFASFGWNAAELIVRDVDGLAGHLQDSPFEIVGSPQDLSFTDAIRAMQVRGPGGEILYLTQFKRPLDALPAPPARCAVDKVFIVIVGGPSLDDLLGFYSRRFGTPTPQRMESRVKAMSEAFGLSPEYRHPIAAVPLRAGCYVEADQMPPAARAVAVPPGHLPPGIAIVSFAGVHDSTPDCVRGPAGEIIEIVA